MKRLSILVFLLVFTLEVSSVFGQQISPGAATTQTGSTGLAAQTCLTVAGSAQQTLTMPSAGGNSSIYIDLLGMWIEATGTVTAAAPVPFTTTGIAGTPSFSAQLGALTIGQLGGPGIVTGMTPIKGTVGVAVTVVSPAAVTNESFRITGCWHIAP